MIDTIGLLISNIVIASGIALMALILRRFVRRQTIVHALLIVAMVKLITPPIVTFPVLDFSGIDVAWNQTVEITEKAAKSTGSDLVEQKISSAAPALSQWQDLKSPSESVANDRLQQRRHSKDSFVNSRPAASGNQQKHYFSPLLLISIGLACLWIVGSAVWLRKVQVGGTRVRRLIELAGGSSCHETKIVERTVDRIARRMGLQNAPRLIVVNGQIVPMVWTSWFSHTLVFPRILLSRLDQKQLETLIAHELAHVWCRHHWVRRLEVAVIAAYWWCPVAWIIRNKIHETEEEICDAWVTHLLPDSSESYATALVDTVNFVNSKPIPLPIGASGISQFQLLKRRITMIMNFQHKPSLSLTGWMLIALMLSIGIPFSANSVHGFAATHGSVSSDDEGTLVRELSEPKPVSDNDDLWDEGEIDIDEMVEELVEELSEEILEMDEEILEEIADVRDDLSDAFQDVPKFVQRAMTQVDIDGILEDALERAPQTARMFVQEVDPAGLIEELNEGKNWGSDDFDPDELREIEAHIKAKLSAGITDLVNRIQREISKAQQEVKNGLGELPATARNQLLQRDIVGVIDVIMNDSSPITRQFMKDAEIRQHISNALEPNRKKRTTRQKRNRRQVRAADLNDRVDNQRDWNDEDLNERRDELQQRIEALAEELDRMRTELRTLNNVRRDRR